METGFLLEEIKLTNKITVHKRAVCNETGVLIGYSYTIYHKDITIYPDIECLSINSCLEELEAYCKAHIKKFEKIKTEAVNCRYGGK